MKNEINLITAAQQEVSKRRRMAGISLVISLALLALSMAAMIITGSWRLVNSSNLKKQKSEIESLQKKITDLSAVEQRQQFIGNRLDAIGKIIFIRPELAKRLEKLAGIFPATVKLDMIELAGQQPAAIKLSIETLDDFQSVLNMLNGQIFSQAAVESVERDKEGVFYLTLNVKEQ